MGSIREKLHKRLKAYQQSQRENRQREAELNKKEKAAYYEAYAKSRVATAQQRGAAAGRQGGGGTLGKAFSTIQKVGERFIGTAEAMYPQYAPRRVPQRRKTTKRHSQKKKSKRDPYLEDLLEF